MFILSVDELLYSALISGLIGTAGITIFMSAVTKSGLANADMIRAVGSLFTKTLKNAFIVGIIIHTISGIIFALIYTIIITTFEVKGVLNSAGAGVLIGFIHGAVVSFVLIAAVAEHHPIKQFQHAGFSVAVAHWLGHIIYGLLAGLSIGLINF